MKVFIYIAITIALINKVTAQTRSESTTNRARRNRNRNSNGNDNEPIEEGRTLGIIRPLLGFGLNTLTRPLAAFGLDEPIAPSRPYRPVGSGLVGATQSDPYYGYGGGGGGNYGGYGGLLSNIFGGYPNYGGYQQQYRPQYGGFNGGYSPYIVGSYRPQQYRPQAYRPQAYRPLGIFGGFNGYPPNNAYPGQQGSFVGQQFAGQQPGISASNGPSAPGLSPSRPGAGGSQIDPAQAAQVANLLGQLLGSQLRPLLSQGGGATASDVPDVSSSRLAG